MNIPTLPTDNLYKFIAIFGLILTALSFYVREIPFDERHRLNKEMRNYNIKMDGYVELRNSIDSTDLIIHKFMEQFDVEPARKYLDSVDLYMRVNENLKKDYADYVHVARDLKNEGKSILSYLEYNDEKVDYYNRYAKGLLFVGGFLIFLGFSLWYHRHQRYIDAERRWEGMIYADKLKKREQQEKEKKKTEPNPDEPKSKSESQEPETESDSDS